jgi:nuclear GTP-binding protein
MYCSVFLFLLFRYESLAGGTCLGGDNLLELLKNYCRSQNLKKSITVGIIGYPNTGKSSLINSLKRSKAAAVGAKPGFTRTMQVWSCVLVC